MRSQALVFTILTVAVLSMTLFSVSYRVQDLEAELKSLDRTIESDRETIRVLKAEWSHLNDPRRLRSLARRHLSLTPVETRQMGSFDALPERPVSNDPELRNVEAAAEPPAFTSVSPARLADGGAVR